LVFLFLWYWFSPFFLSFHSVGGGRTPPLRCYGRARSRPPPPRCASGSKRIYKLSSNIPAYYYRNPEGLYLFRVSPRFVRNLKSTDVIFFATISVPCYLRIEKIFLLLIISEILQTNLHCKNVLSVSNKS